MNLLAMWTLRDLFLQEILRFSLCCRGFTFALQVFFNILIPDHKADAFSPPRPPPSTTGDYLIELFLGGLGRWDAEHFLFIAEHGYLYEHNMAFFPLLPLLLVGLSKGPLWPMKWVLSTRSQLLLSAAVLNCACSALAGAVIYLLGCLVLQNRRTAFLAALLFCISPASIFMAATYSESLFALSTFAGLWLLEKRKTLGCCLLLCLATSARSNGLINVGFLLHTGARAIIQGIGGLKRAIKMLMATLVVTLPFLFFQYYGYRSFCLPSPKEEIPQELLQLAIDKGYHARGTPPVWCFSSIPVAYSYLQSEYWGVGFLKYFQLRQIPNFLLAMPVMVLGICTVWEYARANLHLFKTLGLWDIEKKPLSEYHGSRLFVYIVHFTFLMVFGILCMHVQVITRMLFSSSPMLFWFCAYKIQKNEPWIWGLERGRFPSNPVLRLFRAWPSLRLQTKVLLGYFLGYWFIGTALHVNFLPWT
ncbi:GPI mannosyltransferase 2 [Bombina bombina]|uniref:GPI mannosyltransferase 2 n=1 Tax=Bombina bombina TaxID=8345 RepID=UPI00235ABE10|nr:GPI mannosyltransferase 2 [Bombina bombina]XP_053560743.1 GPI mannosyltransferase 2 [Bombina bombina]XP_053560744.1 GPI mannosyltransferase 2 [Bombina bombina]